MHSSVHAIENLFFITLLQLMVMILAARLGNQLLRRMGQPVVIGEIAAGLLRGPSRPIFRPAPSLRRGADGTDRAEYRLRHGLHPAESVTMLVIMAVVTTAMTGPLLWLLLPRAGYVIPVGVEA